MTGICDSWKALLKWLCEVAACELTLVMLPFQAKLYQRSRKVDWLPVYSGLNSQAKGRSWVGRSKLIPLTDILSDTTCTVPKLAKNVTYHLLVWDVLHSNVYRWWRKYHLYALFHASNTLDESMPFGNYKLSKETSEVIPVMREKFPAAGSVAGNVKWKINLPEQLIWGVAAGVANWDNLLTFGN